MVPSQAGLTNRVFARYLYILLDEIFYFTGGDARSQQDYARPFLAVSGLVPKFTSVSFVF